MASKGKAKQGRREAAAGEGGVFTNLRAVPVKITVELGRAEITLEQAMALGEKSLLAVDRLAEEPVDVCVNGKLFGRGRLVMVGDSYGVQLVELVERPGGSGGQQRLGQ